tara:strand:- start:4348 stop:4641 length:294 start_codon:yes stop_codon:yes gene_type:complete
MSKFLVATEIKKNNSSVAKQQYSLGQVVLNVGSIISMREYDEFKRKLTETESWPEGLDKRLGFTKVVLKSSGYASSGLVLAGDLLTIMDKIEALNGS